MHVEPRVFETLTQGIQFALRHARREYKARKNPNDRNHKHMKFTPQYCGIPFALYLSFISQNAFAQGCIIGRQCIPGAVTKRLFVMPGEFEVSVNYRTFRADQHYNGTTYQQIRKDLNNYVINRQNIWDVTSTIGMTKKSNLVITLPFIDSGWSIPRPIGSATQAPGPRSQQDGKGVGDITAVWRTWYTDPNDSPSQNIAFGLGVKLPTGKPNLTNYLPDRTGANFQQRVIDQSIQPGDGSWGIPVGIEGYKSIGRGLSVFGTLSYLVSPRDTNGVDSGRVPTETAPSIDKFSVPDQYLYRVGIGAGIKSLPGFSAAFAVRKEGVPQKDLFGGHHGWRRPGYSISFEPSVSYLHNDTNWSLSVPVTQFRNRIKHNTDGTELTGDTTFADFQIIMSVSKRFGRK